MPETNKTDTAMLPDTNRSAAEHLFVLEVGLRELIIETLSEAAGPKWFKTHLPTDISQKYFRGIQAERAAKWSAHVAHHPLYYIDFPDLTKILEKNWNTVFKDVFQDKAVFSGSLKSLEPVRNKLAHNRKVSETDRSLVEGVLSLFSSAIGDSRLTRLVRKCTYVPSIAQAMRNLKTDVEAASECMRMLTEPVHVPVWDEIRDAWWFDSAFLTATNTSSKLQIAESKLEELKNAVAQTEKEIETLRNHSQATTGASDIVEPVARFFSLYEDFKSQPRRRGTGHRLEAWREQSGIDAARGEAIESLNLLSNGGRSE